MTGMTWCYLTVLLISCGMSNVLLADEVVRWDVPDDRPSDVLHAGEGVLVVHGALLSSPCTLETSEVALPTNNRKKYHELNIMLSGCGDGVTVAPFSSPAGRENVIVMLDTQLTGTGHDIFPPDWQSARATVLHNGINRLTYRLSPSGPSFQHKQSEEIYRERQNRNALLQLKLMYE